MEILELRNTMTDDKNLLDGLSHRMEITEARISELICRISQ